jgi:hypothetical protein
MTTAIVGSSETILQIASNSAAQQIAEFEIQAAWQAYQTVEKHGLDFGKVCYDQRAKGEVVQGGTTFSRTLDKLNIPRRTAYYWIHSYEISIGVREQQPEKVVPSSPLAGVQMKRGDFLKSIAPVAAPSNPEALSADQPTELTAAPAIESDPELAALFEKNESTPTAAPEPTPAPQTKTSAPSDTTRLRKLFDGTGLEVKQSTHGGKYDLCNLTPAQLREIATLLVSE